MTKKRESKEHDPRDAILKMEKVIKPATERLKEYFDGKHEDARKARLANSAIANYHKLCQHENSANRLKFQAIKTMFGDKKQFSEYVKITSPLALNK